MPNYNSPNNPPTPANVILSKLQLSNFRNYQSANFDFNANIVVIFGSNGVGKTNILESITFLVKGRGLKGAEFDDVINNSSKSKNFTVYCQLNNHSKIKNIGTSYYQKEKKRIFQINGKNTNNIKIYPSIIWLTPQMDSIFIGQKSVRRKFLDNIVYNIDTNHSSRINSYDKLLRERMNLLDKYSGKSQDQWLNIIERKIAELGSAIAIARNEAIEYLNQAIKINESSFIKTQIKIIGELEELALDNKAIEVEEKFMQKLKDNRVIDAQIGRTSFGVHRSDFTAILINKNLEAKLCSTGEQKSILIALTLARVRIFSLLNLPSAILLLDEIVSHLDLNKKQELFKELQKLQIQSFLTGTSKEIFIELENINNKTVQFLEII